MKARYWVSNERGEKDAFDVSNLTDVKKIITTKMNHVLTEDGHVAGGYTLHADNGKITNSNGEFRLIDNKVKYFPDFTETEWA